MSRPFEKGVNIQDKEDSSATVAFQFWPCTTQDISTMFGKTFELSLTKDYVRHWGVAEAVRELIQNALDSESPFIYEFEHEDDGAWTMSLISEHAELPTTSLLLGATTKAEATDKIGSFGEGYKIALLVLTREGLPVAIWNGGKHWAPHFQYSRKYETEILVVEESAMPHPNKGLRFLVSGLSANQVEDIKASCLRMQDNIGGIKQTPWGDILLDQKGRLYVGSLFVGTNDMEYGYNVKPEHLKLERDRQTVDSWDFAAITRKMWYHTGEFDRIALMIAAENPDVEYARYDAPEMVRDACYRWFREQHPDKLVAASQQELKDSVKRAMTVYVGSNMGPLIQQSRHYRNEPKEPVRTPVDILQSWWDEAKYMKRDERDRAFKQLLETARKWRLS